jgi:hypothetical protein
VIRRLFYRGPSRAELHEDYAKLGRIDGNAPIQSRSDIYIAAPVERVWERLIDFQAWPTIDPSFRNVRLDTGVAVDAHFGFVLNNFPIRAQIAVVEPGRKLIWTGTSLWFRAIDLHRLEPDRDGGTHYTLMESFAGVLATLFINSAQLKAQHDRWQAAFKRAVENNP